MLSTQTRSSRVATWASELVPTKYLKSPTPCLYMTLSLCVGQASGGLAGRYAEPGRYLLATTGLHPCIDFLRVQHDLAHIRVETEESIGQSERIERVAHRAHAAHQVRATAADHHVQRRGAMPAEVLAQRIGHRTESLEDVGVVRLAADDEQHVALLDPVFEADTCHLFHLFVRRVAAEVRGDDGVVTEHLGDE